MLAFLVILGAIVLLVPLANRIGVPYPIVLVLGGIAISYIPGAPVFTMPPDLVLVVFLPPLLYVESFTAPVSEFKASAWWIFQLAFGLVIFTTLVVATVAHALIPAMSWAVAFVLGAIVSSTDEVAFVPVADRLRVPRHLVGTIEGESLVNDATSLVLYGAGVAAIVTGTFSLPHIASHLAASIVGALAIGIAAGGIVVGAWRFTRDDSVQAVISLAAPYLSYLPAQHFGFSGVLAVVTTGLFVGRFSPRFLRPSARERGTGFWVTIVFVVNSVIFVLVGTQFHSIVAGLTHYSLAKVVEYAALIALTVVVVRLVWVFGQALFPQTNSPEHAEGKADWSHVAILSWSGMRGGITLAAALAIPLTTTLGPFPDRDLIIFLSLAVLLVTLVGQGGTLPLLVRLLHVTDDGVDAKEERLALSRTARCAIDELERIAKQRDIPKPIVDELRKHLQIRWQEFGTLDESARQTAQHTAIYRQLETELIETQRKELIKLRDAGEIDNTVLRRLQRLLDLQNEEIDLLSTSGALPGLEDVG